MDKKYRVKYKTKGTKRAVVCVIYVKSVKEGQLPLTIGKKIGSITDQCATIALKVIKLLDQHGSVQVTKRKPHVIDAALRGKI
jgi:hypothetical protein